MDTSDPIKVFISNRESKCDDCGEKLGRQAWITLQRDKGALYLTCADLDHLTFLPRGDTALTRRARKHSLLSAVVLKFSRPRKRYERQGLLVEEVALQHAETECLADSDIRARRAERERIRREDFDQQYIQAFASRIKELFPGCPSGREQQIAEHACRKYSGRVGRSAAAKTFDEQAVRLAVIARIRHRETDYDQVLGQGWPRHQARTHVRARVDEISESWK